MTIKSTSTGGEQIVIRNERGNLESVTTSASSVRAMNAAVKAYPRTLEKLAKR